MKPNLNKVLKDKQLFDWLDKMHQYTSQYLLIVKIFPHMPKTIIAKKIDRVRIVYLQILIYANRKKSVSIANLIGVENRIVQEHDHDYHQNHRDI